MFETFGHLISNENAERVRDREKERERERERAPFWLKSLTLVGTRLSPAEVFGSRGPVEPRKDLF